MGVSKVVINNADGTQNVLVDLTGDTVTASSLISGKTAHGANGNVVTGTIAKAPLEIAGTASANNVVISNGSIYLNASPDLASDRSYIDNGQHKMVISAPASSLGDATAADVAMGVTFTSENGVRIVGTNPAGIWATAHTPTSSPTLTTSLATVNLGSITGPENHGFKLNGGGLECPYAGTILILGNAMMNTGFTANDVVHIRVYKGSTATGPDVTNKKVSTSGGTLSISTVVEVAKGDIIYLKGSNTTAARGTFNANSSTRLTIVYLR